MLEYYVVLDTVLRDKPQVRKLLVWCRHCGIPFIADPCNAGREDLGCPFGCADLHRHRRSNERSVRYNASPVGKRKRNQRKEERKLAAKRSAAEASKAAELQPATTVEVAHGAVSRSVDPLPRDREVEPPCPSPAVTPPTTDQASNSAGAVACGPDSRSREDCGGSSRRERGSIAPAEAERVEIAPHMLSYIRVVISLLEGRHIHREEILEMLARTRRQHSFAREKRIDYVLRRLREEPEKPP